MSQTDPATEPAEQALLILGATGDLTARLLLPGIAGLVAAGGPPLRLIGCGDQDWDDAQWQQRVRSAFSGGHPVAEPSRGGPAGNGSAGNGSAGAGPAGDGSAGDTPGPGEPERAALERVAAGARFLTADVTTEDGLRRALAAAGEPLVIYFALPPTVTAAACEVLARIGVPERTRLVLEKPFGHDADSAHALNLLLRRIVPEEQVHRVDHFLGKSTVLNLIGLRFANRIFEPVLDATHVASVDLVFDESLGLEGRAGYYDRAGALADMVQSHLLQVLALLAMDAPPTLTAPDVRDRTAQVLRATRLWDPDPARCTRRSRYTAGEVDGRCLPDYAAEPGVDAARGTETLAEVVLAVDTWRWAGVPFRLRSGKALGSTRKEAVITFRRPPRIPDGLSGPDQPDRLRISFGPDAMALDFNLNGPADPFRLDPVTLSARLRPGELPPYGEVLRGVLDGDPLLSVRDDTAEQCWRILEPVFAAWREGRVPLGEYPSGSDGPAGSLLHSLPDPVVATGAVQG